MNGAFWIGDWYVPIMEPEHSDWYVPVAEHYDFIYNLDYVKIIIFSVFPYPKLKIKIEL